MSSMIHEENDTIRQAVHSRCRTLYTSTERYKLTSSDPGFSRSNWQEFAELGWLGAGINDGTGLAEISLIAEEMGRSLVVEPYIANAILPGQILHNLQNIEANRLLSDVIEGKAWVSLAHLEEMGWNTKASDKMQTTAAYRDGFYILTGDKQLCLGGPYADTLLVTACIDDITHETALFIVPANSPGINIRSYKLLDGQRAADISLDQVQVSGANLIGRGEEIVTALNIALSVTTMACCAKAIGNITSVLWATRDHLRSRSQYGSRLSSYQVLQHRCADMYVEVELARSLMVRAVEAVDNTRQSFTDPVKLWMAKAKISTSCRRIGESAIQLHGALGFCEDHFIGQSYKHLVVLSEIFGNYQSHIVNISRYIIAKSEPVEYSNLRAAGAQIPLPDRDMP